MVLNQSHSRLTTAHPVEIVVQEDRKKEKQDTEKVLPEVIWPGVQYYVAGTNCFSEDFQKIIELQLKL